MISKVKVAKEQKIVKLDLIKIKNFCASEDTINSIKMHNGRKYLQIMDLIKP